MDLPDDLADLARQVIDANRYLTLGTTEPDGRPRLSPVYFTHVDYHDFYWVSSPAARHSTNLADRPEVAIVSFDSAAPIGQGRAVYVSARASLVPDGELPQRCAAAFARVDPDAKRFEPHELTGDAVLRLYRAGATSHEVHVPGPGPDKRRRGRHPAPGHAPVERARHNIPDIGHPDLRRAPYVPDVAGVRLCAESR